MSVSIDRVEIYVAHCDECHWEREFEFELDAESAAEAHEEICGWEGYQETLDIAFGSEAA